LAETANLPSAVKWGKDSSAIEILAKLALRGTRFCDHQPNGTSASQMDKAMPPSRYEGTDMGVMLAG
jgi:hypothetical protein